MTGIERKWHSLAGAAEQLKCSESDVLHLAATGRLRLCYILPGIPARCYRRNGKGEWGLKGYHEGHRGLVGLADYCAVELETKGVTTVQSFLDLSRPGIEWRLIPAAAREDRPQISIRGDKVDVKITRDEVVVRTVDLKAYEDKATSSTSKPNDGGKAESSSDDTIAEGVDPETVAAPIATPADWKEQARAIADDLNAKDRKGGVFSSKTDMADRVAKEMRKRDMSGPRGPLSPSTILREALGGARWKRKG